MNGKRSRMAFRKDCYVNVLRDAMSVDSLDSCGVYFGTTGGQVYASADGGAATRTSPRARTVEPHDHAKELGPARADEPREMPKDLSSAELEGDGVRSQLRASSKPRGARPL